MFFMTVAKYFMQFVHRRQVNWTEHVNLAHKIPTRDFNCISYIFMTKSPSYHILAVRVYVKNNSLLAGLLPFCCLRSVNPPKFLPSRHSHHWLPKITAPQGGALLITPRRADEEHIAVMNLNAPGMMCSADLYQLITLGPMLFHLLCAAFWKERRRRRRKKRQQTKNKKPIPNAP